MPEPGVRRVLMTGDTVGGVWTFTLELAQGLGAHGIEVVLASLGGHPSEEQRVEAESIPNLRLFSSDYKLEWMDDPWRDVEESRRWVLGLEKQVRPDVIHLNSYGHGCLPWQSPVVLTAHSCVLSWWAAVKRERVPSTWNRYRYEAECSLRAADLVTAPSRAMLRTVEENYGPDLPPYRVVPNGRKLSRYRAAEKEPFVLTAGRLWDEGKNVAAVAKVAGRIPWPACVAGEECHPDGKSVDVAGCRALGTLSPDVLADWYARAAIYALPARYEPFGLSALEAGLSGCALVLGDIESLREVWGDAAVFVPPEDTDRLETVLNELIADRERREEMGRRSVARARTFTPERMAQEYLDVYGQVAGAGRMACAS